MSKTNLRADELAMKAYAARLRAESSAGNEQTPPKGKDAGSTPVRRTKNTKKSS